MNSAIIEEKEDNLRQTLICYSLLFDGEEKSRTIRSLDYYQYQQKNSYERKAMVKMLRMLRNTEYLAIEIDAIQTLPLLEYFRQLKKDDLKIEAIKYVEADEKET